MIKKFVYASCLLSAFLTIESSEYPPSIKRQYLETKRKMQEERQEELAREVIEYHQNERWLKLLINILPRLSGRSRQIIEEQIEILKVVVEEDAKRVLPPVFPGELLENMSKNIK